MKYRKKKFFPYGSHRVYKRIRRYGTSYIYIFFMIYTRRADKKITPGRPPAVTTVRARAERVSVARAFRAAKKKKRTNENVDTKLDV